MRLSIIGFLAAALLLLGATTASAIRVDMVSAQSGGTVTAPSQIVVEVNLDTENTVDLNVFAVGVIFDNTLLSYNKAASSSTTYLLWNGKLAKAQLNPASTCGGTTGTGCKLFGLNPKQVQLDFLSNSLPFGVAESTQTDLSVVGAPRLVTLVFDVVGTGVANFNFIYGVPAGSACQLGSLSGFFNCTPTLGPTLTVNVVPEPAVTGLVVAALVTVVGIYRHRRKTA